MPSHDAEPAVRVAGSWESVPPIADQIAALRLADGLELLEYVFRTGRHAERSGGDPGLVLVAADTAVVDGHEVARRIKASERGRDIAVVVMGPAPDHDIHMYVGGDRPERGDAAALEQILRSAGLR